MARMMASHVETQLNCSEMPLWFQRKLATDSDRDPPLARSLGLLKLVREMGRPSIVCSVSFLVHLYHRIPEQFFRSFEPDATQER